MVGYDRFDEPRRLQLRLKQRASAHDQHAVVAQVVVDGSASALGSASQGVQVSRSASDHDEPLARARGISNLGGLGQR